MLVLSRKPNEQIIIGNNIRLSVISIRGNQVRIGIEAPPEVSIFREELVSEIDRAGRSRDFSHAPEAGPRSPLASGTVTG